MSYAGYVGSSATMHLCHERSHPLHGIAASGMHFLCSVKLACAAAKTGVCGVCIRFEPPAVERCVHDALTHIPARCGRVTGTPHSRRDYSSLCSACVLLVTSGCVLLVLSKLVCNACAGCGVLCMIVSITALLLHFCVFIMHSCVPTIPSAKSMKPLQ